MKNVHILPPEIISKIAAGEVIDRPASVLKECIENALDASSQSIEITLRESGKTLIKIKDNGTGIEEDDLHTVFNRHATSKIKSIDDLFNIHSLGFRGEALYSIAAVSDIILRSHTKNADSGWEIHMRGSEKIGHKPVAMSLGTEIEVHELFFNTPARKKFLKSNLSESNQILNTVIPYALFHPSLRIFLKNDEKTLIDLLPAENQLERIAETLNLESKYLHEVKESLPSKNISAHLFLGNINIRRSKRDLQFIFINGRPVENKSISYHMNSVYRLILPDRQFPFFLINLEIPAADIDVNIHPTKREVKIKGEQDLCSFLRVLCEKTLMTQGQAKEVHLETSSVLSEAQNSVASAFKSQTAWDTPVDQTLGWDDHLTPKAGETLQTFPKDQNAFSNFQTSELFEKKYTGLKDKLTNARYIGAFLNKFLFFESLDRLLILDQHAAQERVSFEQLTRQIEKGQIESQNLLTPISLRLTPQDLLAWEELKETLDSLGFTTTLFDKETIAIHSYPVVLRNPEKAVRDLLAGSDISRTDPETLARRACRGSIMSGDKLNPIQCEGLRKALLECADPFTCPHGRPTIVEMSEGFLDKQFLRS